MKEERKEIKELKMKKEKSKEEEKQKEKSKEKYCCYCEPPSSIEKVVDALAKEKVKEEDELSKINSNTKFSFDLDDEIYHKIYG